MVLNHLKPVFSRPKNVVYHQHQILAGRFVAAESSRHGHHGTSPKGGVDAIVANQNLGTLW